MLGPFKLTKTKEARPRKVLSSEQTLVVMRVILRHREKLLHMDREKAQTERRGYYNNTQWPFYEQTHDLMIEDLVKVAQQLVKTALASINVTPE